MVTITISADDAAILRDVLERKILELKKETWHTDHHEFRHLLGERADALERVLAQLAGTLVNSR